MKILYATNFIEIINAGGFANDYLNDLLFHGLRSLPDVEAVDSTPILHLYKKAKAKYRYPLWGKAFTSCFLLEDFGIDRSDIEEKIKNKYYDYIIYGAANRSLNYYGLASSIYEPEKIVIIDGDDSDNIKNKKLLKHKYFKREIYSDNQSLIPIHFAIPKEKIRPYSDRKDKLFAASIPGASGYLFDKEEEYYDDYYRSKFGITMKKAGWDCMRHYEIMANSCIPMFYDIQQCPKHTLTNLNKPLILECLHAFADSSKIKDLSLDVYNYTVENLTTEHLARYVLEKVVT